MVSETDHEVATIFREQQSPPGLTDSPPAADSPVTPRQEPPPADSASEPAVYHEAPQTRAGDAEEELEMTSSSSSSDQPLDEFQDALEEPGTSVDPGIVCNPTAKVRCWIQRGITQIIDFCF